MARIVLITGGARSGKSAHALKLAALHTGRRFFLATAEALDDEMVARIARHKADRSPDLQTIEEPIDLESAIESLNNRADVLVLDCLTLWVSNMMRAHGVPGMGVIAQHEIGAFLIRARSFANALRGARFDSIVVTDEVGAGIVPDNPASRQFRDLLGWTNQKLAEAADEVILMVAGIPLRVK